MADKAPVIRSTDSSQQMAATPIERQIENARPPVPGVDTVRDRRSPDMDRFKLGERERERLDHADPNRTIAFVRNPAHWDRHGATDRVEQVLSRIDGAKVVTRKHDGRPVLEDDTIAISFPKEFDDEYKAIEQQESREYMDRIEQQQLDGQYDPSDEDRKREVARAARAAAHQSGATGEFSPTHGMSYEAAFRAVPDEQRRAMELEARRGGRHVSQLNREQANLKDRVVEQSKSGAKGRGKSFAMGAGFDASGRLTKS